MLEQFTWGQFLCCYGAVSLLWYLGLLFTAYRKETLALLGLGTDGDRVGSVLKFKSQNNAFHDDKSGSRPVQGKDFSNDTTGLSGNGSVVNETDTNCETGLNLVLNNQADKSGARDHDLMGKAKPQQGMERVASGNPVFAPAQKDNGEADQVANGEVATVSLYEDLTAGIREIYEILAANDGNKQDFFGMIAELKAQFGPLGSSPCIARVNTFIRDSAPFAVSQGELESLWD
ncbi:hypothetical protein SRABI27_03726 [Pedobacter sp. Bi27]|uniref:hypothetical protein n=1 Tax=Pedobacter sp. Bi27 TaxID=2822351 RepID=UPI001DE7F9CC|nr:hypothetical protein [Pedobacter sp. Bi27]CAH0279271.1 hypothetical protein SRABI27_03726 [Pedobacter sp. Bi27]